MCIVCKKVKTYAEFAIRTRQSHVDTCKHCYYLKVSTISIKLLKLIYLNIIIAYGYREHGVPVHPALHPSG